MNKENINKETKKLENIIFNLIKDFSNKTKIMPGVINLDILTTESKVDKSSIKKLYDVKLYNLKDVYTS